MQDLEVLALAIAEAKAESLARPNKTYFLFWDGVDEFGIVPEENENTFRSYYSNCTLLSKYRNGEKVE